MKSFCTKGIFYLSLVLLLVGAAACTQSKPIVPTPTLVPLGNDTIVTQPDAQPTAIIVDGVTPAPGDQPTPIPPPDGTQPTVPADGAATPMQGTEGQPTPIIVEPTLLPTPTTVGDTGQPVATPAPGTENNQQPGTSSGACTNPYTVQPGEWFYAIARKCGVSPEALLAANPSINPNLLTPGQTLNMPGGSSGGSAPPPSTDNQPPPASSGSCSNPYTVQQGDTLNSIARKCGTTAAAIQSANGIPAPDYIFPGQQLQIPQ